MGDSSHSWTSTDNSIMDVEQIKVYDRQIRLWGQESQRRLLEATVLFYGLSTTTIEAAKNIFLSGIKIIVKDGRPIDKTLPLNIRQSCLIPRPDPSFNSVGAAVCNGLKEMNPLGSIHQIDEITEDVISKINCIVVDSDISWEEFSKLNILAGVHNVGMCFVANYGGLCMTWFNFHQHHVVDVIGPDAAGYHGVPDGEKREYKTEDMTYRDLSAVTHDLHVMGVTNGNQKLQGRIGVKLRPAELLIKMIFLMNKEDCTAKEAFEKISGSESASRPTLENTYRMFFGTNGSTGKEDEKLCDVLESNKGRVFLPVSTIVGGILCNEIRKFITKVQIPVDNSIVVSLSAGAITARV